MCTCMTMSMCMSMPMYVHAHVHVHVPVCACACFNMRRRGEDGDHAAGLRAAAWALEQVVKCNFRGASWAAKSRAKAKAVFSG
jgi:hypothetical protein